MNSGFPLLRALSHKLHPNGEVRGSDALESLSLNLQLPTDQTVPVLKVESPLLKYLSQKVFIEEVFCEKDLLAIYFPVDNGSVEPVQADPLSVEVKELRLGLEVKLSGDLSLPSVVP